MDSEERKGKQEYLKKEIIDKGFDRQEFAEFMINQKPDGLNVDNWDQRELIMMVEEFVSTHSPVKNANDDLIYDEPQEQYQYNEPQDYSPQSPYSQVQEYELPIPEQQPGYEYQEGKYTEYEEGKYGEYEEGKLGEYNEAPQESQDISEYNYSLVEPALNESSPGNEYKEPAQEGQNENQNFKEFKRDSEKKRELMKEYEAEREKIRDAEREKELELLK